MRKSLGITKQIVRASVAKFESHELRHVRRTLEAELLAAMAAGEKGNTAHLGKLELLEAIGAELDGRLNWDRTPARNEPNPSVEVWYEDGFRLSFGVRCF